MITIGIDPGIGKTGLAMLSHGQLIGAHLFRDLIDVRDWAVSTLTPSIQIQCVIECPQVYRTGASKGDPNDLLKLAVLVGRLQEILERCTGSRCVLALPREWKGSVPKDIHNKRVVSALSTAELACLDLCLVGVAKSNHNDVVDAIGIAKWAHTKL